MCIWQEVSFPKDGTQWYKGKLVTIRMSRLAFILDSSVYLFLDPTYLSLSFLMHKM